MSDAYADPKPPVHAEVPTPPAPPRDILRRSWDFSLTIATVAILGLLGVQSFVGTLYTWWAARTIAGWQQGTGYAEFVTLMNQIAAPLVVALVIVMGLCVPKRLFERRALVIVSAAMVGAGIGVFLFTSSLQSGLGTYLALSALIQAAVVVLTVAGVRGPSYLTEGRLTKTGSGLLHLGFIGVAFVIVTLERSNLMLPVFFASALCLAGGTALAFYAETLAWHRVVPPEDQEEDEAWSAEATHDESPTGSD
jgi:hypothetical protein